MLSIQEAGIEILNNNPRKLYAFVGSEYGIKKKYLSIMKDHYKDMKECKTMNEIITFMSTKHFIPLQPCLYVVRYDEEFIASLSEITAKKLLDTNIIGTIVCIYDSEKHATKLEKFLPNNTVRIDAVNTNFKIKYLHSDFPHLPDKLINIAAEFGSDYNQAQLMCESMSQVPPEELFALSDKQLLAMFGKSEESSEAEIREAVAAKNFSRLMNILESYTGDLDNIFYTILSTMIEIDKLFEAKYAQSDIKDYVKRWMEPDVYNMFMNTYAEIKKLRSYSTDAYSSLVYLFSLLKFDKIPSVEFMGG